MRRAVLAVAATVALALLAVPAAAHIDTLSVDSQVSDGEVRVESAYLLSDGYVVVHEAGPNGSLGDPLGHVALDAYDFRTGMVVPVDDEAWASWGNHRRVRVALHEEGGGDGFDPATDPVVDGAFGKRLVSTVTVGKADAETSVVAERFEPQTPSTDAVEVRRVALARPGYVAVRPETEDGPGPVVGTRALAAGVHENVTVQVDAATFADSRRRTFVAQLYAGTGAFADAEPVRVGNATVDSSFDVERVGNLSVTTESTGTATATPAETTADGPVVVTATPTPSPTPTPTAPPPTAPGGTSPGFGLLAALTALLALAGATGLASRRR